MKLYRVRYLFVGTNGEKIFMSESPETARRAVLDVLPQAVILSVTEVSNG